MNTMDDLLKEMVIVETIKTVFTGTDLSFDSSKCAIIVPSESGKINIYHQDAEQHNG